jgi:hypothetical protein
MAIPTILIILGLLTQVVVLIATRNRMPYFTQKCRTCNYQLPIAERPPAFFDCPECDRRFSLSDPLLRL